jgi:hypothetical protein
MILIPSFFTKNFLIINGVGCMYKNISLKLGLFVSFCLIYMVDVVFSFDMETDPKIVFTDKYPLSLFDIYFENNEVMNSLTNMSYLFAIPFVIRS